MNYGPSSRGGPPGLAEAAAAELAALPADGRRALPAWRRRGRFARRASAPSATPGGPGERRLLLDLSSNDYLGLSTHPRVVAAAVAATGRHGVGGGSSRLIAGGGPVHAALEASFAAFKHAEAAVLLPTGYHANLALLGCLAGPGDLVLQDKRNHASLLDAGRLCGADGRRWPHGRLDRLAALLRAGAGARRRIVVTDSVFSMDGDCADLPALCDLCEAHGAWLVVDEAHATGVLGAGGAGLAEHQGVTERVAATVSTASKALGSLGGLVSGPRPLIDLLANRARPLIYTTAAPPGVAAAIAAAVAVVRDEPHRRHRLAAISARLRRGLAAAGWPVAMDPTPILPLPCGTNAAALALSRRLRSAGFLAPAIRPPTVPPGTARVRLSLRCDLLDAELDRLRAAIGAPPQAVS
ncbi:aminotransferase class I/II-fold pyridoxal phosphate-dependent enzyme [Phycisphaera mikurensis]|uniref:8-amino-7-oxononanoate synthase n=1 Tax=Phycisphaera mikurensis (strain NBRC 102666 / KCTC 22515 / FYK2301M01) TaxID=1142394 RepID=I0IH42_PHYMF|nr:aminotransferase class I/II-fold pyridoxal phosphate-dependent enzyme [Phycisphaera mikurensis]MBB6440834.1 8-amino-7-oxononanoate synthase [Phycisphaera mikurensis]BAM04580.1 8-amino-7-oxononanoate synthase [Phycisphaera mikurensis NBRC 102666]